MTRVPSDVGFQRDHFKACDGSFDRFVEMHLTSSPFWLHVTEQDGCLQAT